MWVVRQSVLTATPTIPEIGDLESVVKTWQHKTFGAHPPEGSLMHLRREVRELLRAHADEEYDHAAEEAADIVIVLMDYARRTGFDLLHAVCDKMLVNLGRTWAPPDKDGVIQHQIDDETTNTREATELALQEQPMPTGRGVRVEPLILADLWSIVEGDETATISAQRVEAAIKARTAYGIEEYGEPLTTMNGRNPVADGWQEIIDFIQYSRQAVEERPDDVWIRFAYDQALRIALDFAKELAS